ncbi:MAG: site-specific integrase [Rhodanobacteraceae bacterium]|nr:MAG: site-specific integrase [Rhodanobacteraceae bacterium]
MATITRRDSGHWKAIIRLPRFGVRLRAKTFRLRADAEAWARQTEDQIQRGVWRDTSEAERTSLRDALTRYENEVTPRKRSAVSEASVLRIIREDAGSLLDRGLQRVDGGDLARLRDKWKRDGVKPATIRRRMALLSHLFTVARKEWGMSGLQNPARDVALPVVRDARSRRVTDPELEAIIAATGSSELPAFVRLLQETAMRRGELHALRWQHVNLPDATAFLPATKNGTHRTVPLSPAAIDILRSLPRRIDGRVFGIGINAFTKAFGRAVRRARAQYEADCKEKHTKPDPAFLVDVRLHDERHEATTRLAQTFGVLDLRSITGHKDLRMLARYYNPDPKELAKRMRGAGRDDSANESR